MTLSATTRAGGAWEWSGLASLGVCGKGCFNQTVASLRPARAFFQQMNTIWNLFSQQIIEWQV